MTKLQNKPVEKRKASIPQNSKNFFKNWLLRQHVHTLATEIGCNDQLIYFWRSGKCTPSLPYVKALMKYNSDFELADFN